MKRVKFILLFSNNLWRNSKPYKKLVSYERFNWTVHSRYSDLFFLIPKIIKFHIIPETVVKCRNITNMNIRTDVHSYLLPIVISKQTQILWNTMQCSSSYSSYQNMMCFINIWILTGKSWCKKTRPKRSN